MVRLPVLAAQGRVEETELKVTAEWAAAHTHIAGLALGSSLLEMDGVWFCQLCPAALDHESVGIVFAYLLFQVFFYAVEFEGREIVAVGHGFEAVVVATDAGEAFDVRVPWRDVGVADGPFDAVSVACGCGEVVGAPSWAGPAPDEGFAAYLVTADPVKWFFLDIGMIFVFYKKVGGVFSEAGCGGDQGVFFYEGIRHLFAMREFPGGHGGGGIVFVMDDVAAAFEDEGFEAVVAEFFCGPAAADAGTDDDGVVGICLLGRL